MCIRDSAWLAENVPQDRGPAVVLHGDAGPGNFLFGEDNRCLLYTSDAADERSSVDLGGRRIIKKKKKQNKQVRRGGTTQE